MTPYLVYGLNQSYFTRKMTGYLDHKGIPWRLKRFAGAAPEVLEAGWPGGMPAVGTPEGEIMWDSSAMIGHLELRFPDPSVLPEDPLQRFLCYLIEDVCDEWLYRPAVGSRWHFDENAGVAGYELAREASFELPIAPDDARSMLRAYVLSSCPPLGVTAENIGLWIDEVLRPWLRVLGAHLETRPFLFGGRPSLADFAAFGGNAAHFTNDPLCRRWTEEDAPSVVRHTNRLVEPELDDLGPFDASAEPPATLVALLADLGRLYLPWVSRATVEGKAEVRFEGGPAQEVAATDFLVEARGVLLTRYLELRCDRLDAVLEQAGILAYFAEFSDRALELPDLTEPPRPRLNRPFPPEGE